eukprot:CAMPEP_0202877182 /NCGR_PEP_ID=MMETSP1391-20130828/30233_1 /ASSEMBLY_ACC=CAM_ASM_000867 /TAXON_ID=1034604 /ORGANISM="Chlamydomonas leiostraca, Strain SAG 11-49" /LENGTH=454 /DNA_ID=CAMNT_0049559165 /DNA_START=61 /DNA_END=1422 /DNA_ORIENTATION=+
MAGTAIKFDTNTAAAKTLVQDCFKKLKQIWNPDLQDTSVAEYAVACVAKGRSKDKTLTNLQPVFGQEAAPEVLNWLLGTVKARRTELTTAAPAPKPAQPAPVAAPAPAQAPAQAPDDVEALLQSEDAGAAVEQEHREERREEHREQREEPRERRDHSHREAEARDGGHRSEGGSRRLRSAIQWADPRGSSGQQNGSDAATQRDAELAARRARFGGGEERPRGRSRSRSPAGRSSRPDPHSRDGGMGRSTEFARSRERDGSRDGSGRGSPGDAPLPSPRPRLRSAVTRSDSGADGVEPEKAAAAPLPAAPQRLFGGIIRAIKQGDAEAAAPKRGGIFDRLGGGPTGKPSVFDRLTGARKRGHEVNGDDSPQGMGKAVEDDQDVPVASPSKAPRGAVAALGPGATAASALRQLASASTAKALQAQGRMTVQASMPGRVGALGLQSVQQAVAAAAAQ